MLIFPSIFCFKDYLGIWHLSKVCYWFNSSLPKIIFHDNRMNLEPINFWKCIILKVLEILFQRKLASYFQPYPWIKNYLPLETSKWLGASLKLDSPFLGIGKKPHDWQNVVANTADTSSLGNISVGHFTKYTLSNASYWECIHICFICIGYDT